MQRSDNRMIVIIRRTKASWPLLNAAWRSQKAEFIARMDSDDISVPERLSKFSVISAQNPDVALVRRLCANHR